MRCQQSVEVLTSRSRLGVGMDQRGIEPGQCVEQLVLSLDRNGMGLNSGAIRRDHDLALGAELVADPSQPDLTDVADAWHTAEGGLSMVDERGIDGIHEPSVDLTSGLAQHQQDGDRDYQADYRIRPLPSKGYAPDA
jgi:hypothetical protein